MPVFRSLRRKARLGRGDVLFASGLTGVSMRYRCRNQCEALAHAGLDCDVVLERETDLDAALGRYRCVVLHRVAWTPKVERFVARARRHGTPVLFDVDDLVFEPAAAGLPTDRLDAAARRRFDAEVAALRSTLAASDGVLVSTEPLRAHAAAVNAQVEIVHNAVNAELVELAEEAVARRGERSTDVTFAYASGTPTHDRDFAVVAQALVHVLETLPQARLRVVGFLEADERLAAFGERVEHISPVGWREVPRLLATADVNLAPLVRSPFTEAKSCLKYVEAALLRLPTVASPRSDFARVIVDGETGLLAESVPEWSAALRALAESREARERIGAAAYADVCARHTTRARADEARRAVRALTRGRVGGDA